MCANKLVSMCDILSTKPRLYIDGSSRYKTVSGCVLSVLVAILSLLAFVAFGQDLFARSSPSSLTTREYSPTSKVFGQDIFFAVAPGFTGNIPVQNGEKKLMYKLRHGDADTKRNSTIVTWVDMVPCSTTTRAYKYNLTQNVRVPFEYYYCLPDSNNLTLSGRYGSSKYQLYSINVM